MLIFLIFGGLFKLLASQTLYESVIVNNTILHDGMELEPHILLENCDKLLQDERTKSFKMGLNVNKLTKKLEISNLALMAFQRSVNVTGKQFISYKECILIR